MQRNQLKQAEMKESVVDAALANHLNEYLRRARRRSVRDNHQDAIIAGIDRSKQAHTCDPTRFPMPAIRDHGSVSQSPIAIVGLSCRFPGGVTNPDEYWNLL